MARLQNRGTNGNQGMNWIKQTTRLAIYLRDDLACAWCGTTVEDGAKMTLDHLIPRSFGGSNKPDNLVTCCYKCNSVRGDRSVEDFAVDVAAYLDQDPQEVLDRINLATSSPLKREEAREIVAHHGSVARHLANCRKPMESLDD